MFILPSCITHVGSPLSRVWPLVEGIMHLLEWVFGNPKSVQPHVMAVIHFLIFWEYWHNCLTSMHSSFIPILECSHLGHFDL